MGQVHDVIGQRFFRIDEYGKTIDNLAVLYFYRTNLDNLDLLGIQAGGLNIKDHIGIVQGLMLGILNDELGIIDQIAFHAIDYLKITGYGMSCIREGLNHTMISDCQCLMSPFHGLFNNVRDFGNTIHIAHLGMAMEFHTFLRGIVHTRSSGIHAFHHAKYRSKG